MKNSARQITVLSFLFYLSTVPLFSKPFIAFSLNEAAECCQKSSKEQSLAKKLAGMTRIAGMVYDENNHDVIIVGEVVPDEPSIELDDLVVAMRARLKAGVWPKVSIDKTPETHETKLQTVRFEGAVENTKFGVDLLRADVTLKKLALGLFPTKVWGFDSYFSKTEDFVTRNGDDDSVSSRFWFEPRNILLSKRENVFAISDLRIGVKVQLLAASSHGKPRENLSEITDQPAAEFARDMSSHYDDLRGVYPEIGRLTALFDLVGLAEGIRTLPTKPDINYWLNEYKIATSPTDKTFPLLSQTNAVQIGGTERTLEINGGIEVRALVSSLQDGDVTALRDAVLKSKPDGKPLVWQVPLEGWSLAGYPDETRSPPTESNAFDYPKKDIGCFVTRQVSDSSRDFGNLPNQVPAKAFLFSSGSAPRIDFNDHLFRQTMSPSVGGVMLSGSASIEGNTAASRFTSGAFDFVLNGENARLQPKAFKKFVTALWSVYYSKEDPGISIDPIAWGVDKQLVRYIGRVINTDLGRVMREADYKMKSMAVGVEQPKTIPGFKSVDEWCGKKGMNYADAFRRFWFTPTNMTFKASDNALIFDMGKILLQTEYMLQNQPTRAVECDQQFADFFTKHYDAITKEYPIYGELFEYAKLVSLAKYVKDKGIPLQWFLLANLDQVLTEDSKGAVDTLSKGSKFLKDFRIEGGVDMQEKYVLDQTAATAIQQAMARVAPQRGSKTSLGQAEALQSPALSDRSFQFEKHNFSIVPQHSLSSGKDLHGVRYQTDIALRGSGEPGLELVRYFSPSIEGDEPAPADFGKGWRLLIPFRAIPLGPPSKQMGNVLITEKWLVKNLLNGRQEVLTFDETNYALAGYRPANLTNSQFLGMFWTGGGFLRLGDKIGNEFWFDSSGVLREMHFSEDFGVRFEYDYEEAERESFHEPPFVLSVVGTNVETGFTIDLPTKLKLTERMTGHAETFHFGTNQNDVIGYLSDNIVFVQRRFIALRRDGTHVLEEPSGNEIWFDINREFVKQRNVVITRMAQGHYQWNDAQQDLEFVENHSVKFNHQFADGRFVVNSAQLFEKTHTEPILTVKYEYTKDWMLAKVSSSGRKEARTTSHQHLASNQKN